MQMYPQVISPTPNQRLLQTSRTADLPGVGPLRSPGLRPLRVAAQTEPPDSPSSWTSRCGCRKSAASACRSRGGITTSPTGNGTAGRAGGVPMSRVDKCPLAITADATMSLLNEVAETLGRPSYFIPVLVFPDMEPDAAISKWAERSNVHLVWRTDPLLSRLVEIAREVHVRRPPEASGHTTGGGDRHRRPGAVLGAPRCGPAHSPCAAGSDTPPGANHGDHIKKPGGPQHVGAQFRGISAVAWGDRCRPMTPRPTDP